MSQGRDGPGRTNGATISAGLGWRLPDASDRVGVILRSRDRIIRTREVIARTSITVFQTRTMKVNSVRMIKQSAVAIASRAPRGADRYASAGTQVSR